MLPRALPTLTKPLFTEENLTGKVELEDVIAPKDLEKVHITGVAIMKCMRKTSRLLTTKYNLNFSGDSISFLTSLLITVYSPFDALW
mmetsp:Transcript_6346/g.7950  ORF Transcript_6346/g.7950 Transcript_6346/m.7950 type:complete len:87 (-) Transcript_6346:319-579(-)